VSVPSLIRSIRSIPSSVQKNAKKRRKRDLSVEKGVLLLLIRVIHPHQKKVCALPVIRESADLPTLSDQLDIISLVISLAVYQMLEL
jgi:hypothetical protein